MNRLGKLFMAASLAALPMACKDDTRKAADRAAENVQEQKEDLREETGELKEAIKDQSENLADRAKSDTELGADFNDKQIERNADEIKEASKEVAGAAQDVRTAEAEFDIRRHYRVQQLRLVHDVIATQPMLISTISAQTALTDKARAGLAEKMQVFQMRIDEAGNAIEAVQGTDEKTFEDRNDAASKAMDRLEDAREDAWEALNDGDRIEAS